MNRLITSLCLVAFATSDSGAQSSSSERDATKAVTSFVAAWNRHDMRAFGELFRPQADFVNVSGTWWRGRASIQKNHAFLHGTISRSDTIDVSARHEHFGIFRTTSLAFDSVKVRLVSRDIAVAHAAWSIAGDARTSVTRQGLFVFVLSRNDKSWRIETAQNTEINRPPELSK